MFYHGLPKWLYIYPIDASLWGSSLFALHLESYLKLCSTSFRAKLLYTGTRRFQFDGLNSVQYKVTSIKLEPLYTHILVDIGKPPKGF